eukprot:635938-Pleurochrysis_carterae.AAC.7
MSSCDMPDRSSSIHRCSMRARPAAMHCNTVCIHTRAFVSDADAKLQLLVQQELDLAFQGVEDKIATADEAEAMAQIQQSADLVLQKVLTQMQADGEVLRGELDDRMANYTQMCRDSLLSKYDVSMADFQAEADGARTVIREEMARLTSLNQEYKEITASQAPSRNSVVGVIAFLVGLIYLGGAVNEWLKLALGAIDGDVTETVGSALVQSALAAVGIGTYFSRRGREGKEE